MITRVAIEQNGKVYIGAQGKRHDSVIHDMVIVHSLPKPIIGVQGFIDHTGTFLNRHDAAIHAFECGQLPNDKICPEIILSEDLW